jgi:uncharacterized RDD family membrane protein YckC
MRILRTPLLAAVVLLTAAAAPATLSAQSDGPRLYRFNPVIRIAQDYTVPAGQIVREVRMVFGDLTIEGQVDGDVLVILGSARLGPGAVVDGTLAVIGGSATIDPTVVIHHDLVVIGGTLTAPESFLPDGDHVVIGTPWLGGVLRDVVPWITRGLVWGRLIVPDLPWVWTVVGIFFLLYLALSIVFDRAVTAAADAVGARPLSMFMAGLLVLILALPVIAIVAASVIGLALVPFILCAIIVAALMGKAAVARAIGRSVIKSEAEETRGRAIAAFVIGFAVLTLAYMVPVLGFMTWALTGVMGLGAASMTLRGMLRRERPPAAPAPPSPEPPAPPAGRPAAPADFDGPAAPPAVAFSESYDAPEPAVMPAPPPPRTAFMEGLAHYPRATFLDRLAAFALDCLLVAIASELLEMNRHEGFFPLLLLAYHIAFWTWRGTTLGGIICSLRVVRTTGGPLRPADALVRGLSSVFSLAALGIGCFWMLQDPESQTWHDKIAGTLVVKVPRELVLP